MKTYLNKIIKFSNVDGPGNRMAIFFQNCNFNCKYCHNPETISLCVGCGKCVEVCPSKALEKVGNEIRWIEKNCIQCDRCTEICSYNSSPKVKNITVEELLNEIRKVKSFIKGITVSGGESTLNYIFLTELFKRIKEEFPKLTCFVDTNGSLNLSDEKYKDFVNITDSFMLDVKAWDEKEHLDLVGVDNKNVIKNLKYLLLIKKLYEVRTVIVDKYLNNELTVKEVSKIISNANIRYKIIKYRSIGVRESMKNDLKIPTDIILQELKEIANSLNVKNALVI